VQGEAQRRGRSTDLRIFGKGGLKLLSLKDGSANLLLGSLSRTSKQRKGKGDCNQADGSAGNQNFQRLSRLQRHAPDQPTARGKASSEKNSEGSFGQTGKEAT